MKWLRPRMTIGRLMVVVAVVALFSAILLAVPPTIDPLLRDRGFRLGTGVYLVVVAVLSFALAAPWIAAVALSFDVVARARRTGRLPWRRFVIAVALFAVGSAVVLGPVPPDGLRYADRLDRETFVMFYHQYRFWPGRHITPCLEILSERGGRLTYPIPLNRSCHGVRFQTNVERTMVWVVENPHPPSLPSQVLGCLNLATGEFVGTPGPFPAGVTEQGGFPPLTLMPLGLESKPAAQATPRRSRPSK